MEVIATEIPDVKILQLAIHQDSRGFFMESWRDSWAEDIGLNQRFVQDNFSRSIQHTLRGLHYQIEQPQAKLVRISAGEVFDVAVDLRRSSPTFGRWVGVKLSADNGKVLFIPEGFAHGFYVLSEMAEYTYKCTNYYFAPGERTLKWDDPDLGIHWPVAPQAQVIVSQKDQQGVPLSRCEAFS